MEQEELDAALAARCRNGDRESFAVLVARYQRPVFNLAYRMLGDRDEALDVAQTAFLKVLENLGQFNPRFRFFSWLYRIALNEALDQIGRRGRQAELTDMHVAEDDPVKDVAVADAGRRTRRALLALNPEQRAVIVLRHYHELSYEQIGEVLELPDSTVKSRLYEARDRLRGLLGSSGLEH